MKNVRICLIIFFVYLGWGYVANLYITKLQNQYGVMNSSTSVLNYSHESNVMITHYQQFAAAMSIIILVALSIFSVRAYKEGSKITGVLFMSISVLGIAIGLLACILLPLNTIYIG